MNIEKFKQQHVEILESIAALRALVQSGISTHANEISQRIVAMSSVVKLHLAVEDRILYPALEASSSAALSNMSVAYRLEMSGIKETYTAFAARWNNPQLVEEHPEAFRDEANSVLKLLYTRMKKEDAEFYPAIESSPEFKVSIG